MTDIGPQPTSNSPDPFEGFTDEADGFGPGRKATPVDHRFDLVPDTPASRIEAKAEPIADRDAQVAALVDDSSFADANGEPVDFSGPLPEIDDPEFEDDWGDD